MLEKSSRRRQSCEKRLEMIWAAASRNGGVGFARPARNWLRRASSTVKDRRRHRIQPSLATLKARANGQLQVKKKPSSAGASVLRSAQNREHQNRTCNVALFSKRDSTRRGWALPCLPDRKRNDKLRASPRQQTAQQRKGCGPTRLCHARFRPFSRRRACAVAPMRKTKGAP